MSLESVHACDCCQWPYVRGRGQRSERRRDYGRRGGHGRNTYVVGTKMLIDRSWIKETGEDHKEHFNTCPILRLPAPCTAS